MKKIECIKNKNMNYLCDIQSEQIAELEQKLAVAERELKTSIGYLITGKRLFAGHTTNSLVDDFIQRYEAKAELRKERR